MKRNRRRRRWITVAALVVVAAGIGAGLYLWLGGSGSQEVRYITSRASNGSVSQTVEADFTLVSAREDTSITPGATGVVTAEYLSAGQRISSLQRLAVVSGDPVFALVSDTPLYRELTQGDSGANVRALEKALEAHGYDHGDVDGYFDASTEQGLEDWQADQNIDVTGSVDLSTFAWVPAGSIISSVTAAKGTTIGGQSGLATVSFPEDIEATASVGQTDVSSLKKGQTAVLSVDGHESAALEATVSSIATSSSSSSSSSSAAQATSPEYAITLKLSKLPSWALVGMTGSLTITIREKADVLVVPTEAIAGTATDPYVRVMVDGAPVQRRVETGMTSSTTTEITAGLTSGETVVLGEITSDGSSTSASSGSGTFNLGGLRRASGGQVMPGSGSFQPPAGGGTAPQAAGQ